MFERTVKAWAHEKNSAWETIKKAANDCDRERVVHWTGVGTIAQLHEELDDAKIPVDLSACKDRLGVAGIWWNATDRDAATLEKISWSVVRLFWHAAGDFDAHVIAGVIQGTEYGKKGQLTESQALAYLSSLSGGDRHPRAWTDEKVINAFAIVDGAYIARDGGDYEPGDEAAWLMDMHRPERHDWNAIKNKWAEEDAAR